MQLELKKSLPVRLRSLGLDERWLQDRIAEDPSLLGLGDLDVIRRERSQPSGGRIDFLMHDPDEDTRYEIEIMLGSLDERHIIRTIEYWDIERQRYPSHEHRAVIVAEEITSRFFNVIRLLNRAVPLIALQLSAFRIDDSVVLHFTKVLDVLEAAEEAEDVPTERADRRYWETRANQVSLAVADRVLSLLPSTRPARVTYNRGHIAVGTTGYNFLWLHPRKASHCHVQVKPGNENREAVTKKLEEAGVPVAPYKRNSTKFKLTAKDLDVGAESLRDVLALCEEWSRQGQGSTLQEEA